MRALATVRHLLRHWGGWDRAIAFEPTFSDFVISNALRRPLPTTPQTVLDYMETQPLPFTPGERFAYSNFGYTLLGLILEPVTGQSYKTYVRENVLAPIGIFDLRVGQLLLTNKLPAEVDYEDPLRRVVDSVMGAGSPPSVPITYGGWNIRTMDAHGGWVASAASLARFISAFDAPTNSPLLSSAMIGLMWSRPPGEVVANPYYYGAGWSVRPLANPPGTLNAWHSGLLDGTYTYFVRLYNGISWVALFNRSPSAPGAPDYSAIDPEINNAVFSVASWPGHNLFDADSDGLLDSWELNYFGSTNAVNGGPTQDADGNRASNLAEYISHTHPRQPANVPRFEAVERSGANAHLRWVTQRGRPYSLESSPEIRTVNAWTPVNTTNWVGDGAIQSVTASLTTATQRHYRLNIRLQKP